MGKEITWEPKKVKVADLKENPDNPKILNEKGKSRLQKTLAKYGLAGTIICNSDLSIVDGHSRKKELIEKDIKQVWVSVPSRALTEKEYKEFNAVIDLARAGDPDMMLIEETFGDEFMEEWGLEKKKSETIEDDFSGQTPKTPITKTGYIYELNQHRLQCGDSCVAEVVTKTLDGSKPVLMVTDPPYGVNYDPAWRHRAGRNNSITVGKVLNDEKVNWTPAYTLFGGNICYIWHAGKHGSEVQQNIEECGFEVISQIIWAKSNFALSRGDYHWMHEPCLYAVRKGAKHSWQGSRKETTLWQIMANDATNNNREELTGHGAQKPIECMARPIRNNTYERQSVYDPFLGSGTTIIAADQLNRACYGQEIDPGYCDLTVARYAKFRRDTGGSLAIKKNGRQLSDKEIQQYLDNTNAEK